MFSALSETYSSLFDEETSTVQLPSRLRRCRRHPVMRDLVQSVWPSAKDFVLPLFIKADLQGKKPILSMPGQFQLGLDALEEEIQEAWELGIRSVLLFGLPSYKDEEGSASWSEEGVVQKAIQVVKTVCPGMLVMVDICQCQYTNHGHCGLLEGQEVVNDPSIRALAKQAVSKAKAGADVLAPSANMDGMVGVIRTALDEEGFSHLPIMSYAVKYASAFYGTFRQALDSKPQFGDRKGYQMNPGNRDEGLRECALDLQEGADILMVKPATAYLDVIRSVKDAYPGVPLAAYCVSGEYSMVKAAAEKGWIDEKWAVLEMLTCIKRAGADFILHYWGKDACRWVAEG